jgi:hypothetical protein
MSSSVETQTATITSPAASASTALLVAAAGNRKGCIITNEGSTILYLAFAATASTTAYTVQVPATTGTFTLDPTSGYGGPISGIWAGSPTGNARVTTW